VQTGQQQVRQPSVKTRLVIPRDVKQTARPAKQVPPAALIPALWSVMDQATWLHGRR